MFSEPLPMWLELQSFVLHMAPPCDERMDPLCPMPPIRSLCTRYFPISDDRLALRMLPRAISVRHNKPGGCVVVGKLHPRHLAFHFSLLDNSCQGVSNIHSVCVLILIVSKGEEIA